MNIDIKSMSKPDLLKLQGAIGARLIQVETSDEVHETTRKIACQFIKNNQIPKVKAVKVKGTVDFVAHITIDPDCDDFSVGVAAKSVVVEGESVGKEAVSLFNDAFSSIELLCDSAAKLPLVRDVVKSNRDKFDRIFNTKQKIIEKTIEAIKGDGELFEAEINRIESYADSLVSGTAQDIRDELYCGVGG